MDKIIFPPDKVVVLTAEDIKKLYEEGKLFSKEVNKKFSNMSFPSKNRKRIR